VLSPDRWVPLAEIARPHGVKGEVRLRLFNAESDLLLEAEEVLLRTKDGAEHEVSVDGARRADDAILMKLHSVDDRDRAAELRGALVCLKRGSFPAPEQGEFYACDVLGAEVLVKKGEGYEALGTVREYQSYPTTDVLVVRPSDGGKDWEVPLVDKYVEEVDVERGRVLLLTLDGLERG
jgi:16S rRNA processing protein RimM